MKTEKKIFKEEIAINYYLLSKKDMNDFKADEFNNDNYLLIKDISQLDKRDILDLYKDKGYIKVIQIGKDSFNELSTSLKFQKTPGLSLVEEIKEYKNKKIFKEIEAKDPGYHKYDNESIVEDIKKYCEKNKNTELKNIQIEGELLTVDIELEYDSEEENLFFRREKVKQLVYDTKTELEKALRKKAHDFLPLSVQGIDIQPKKARFELVSMLSFKTRANIEMYVG